MGPGPGAGDSGGVTSPGQPSRRGLEGLGSDPSSSLAQNASSVFSSSSALAFAVRGLEGLGSDPSLSSASSVFSSSDSSESDIMN